jgi:CubicO group peptidase (beta-lactamase class C family)
MTRHRRFVFPTSVSFVFIAVLVNANADDRHRAPATELAGLWAARRDYGPEVRGNLDLYKLGEQWMAKVAGFAAPATVHDRRVTFEVAGNRGAFRGYLDPVDGTIRGHWIQPPTAAHGVRFASPVELGRRNEGHWRGAVTPLDDTMTFFFSLVPKEDGSIGGFLRNPEANYGRHFEIDRVVREGNLLLFLEPNRPEARLQGPYYPDHDAFSIFIPGAGGTFDFTRVDADGASPFYPRPLSAGRYSYHPPSSEDDGWETGSLEEVGMAVGPIEEMIRMIVDAPIDSISAPYIHAVLIARHGKLVLEEYFHGYSADIPHETRSASKTVTATLIGIASHEGEPVDLDSRVYSIMYGAELLADLDPRKKRMTLKHLLTMTPGLDCDDNDDDSPGSEWRMQSQTNQPDWVRYTLDLPMAHEPGEHVAYCSASPNLAGGVLARASGSWLPDLYQRYFARPMQMDLYHMNLMPNGEAYGGGGLYIKGRDFLKLGQIFLDGGKWKNRKLLGDEWAREAISPFAHMFDQGYGYAWWLLPFAYEDRTVRAFYAGGNGGQYVIGIPELDLVVVFFAGNYSQAVTHLVKKKHIPDYIIKSVEHGVSHSE